MLNEMIKLANDNGIILIATADKNCIPHIAAAKRLSINNDCAAVEEWFCPCTMENISVNRNIAIVVWDNQADIGCQLIGKVQDVSDEAIMDGFLPGFEKFPPLPQVERQLLVKIEKILEFKLAPHSDIEE